MSTPSLIHLTISNVGEQLYRGDVVSVNVPGVDGEMTLLAHHEALITLLKPGRIKILEPDSPNKKEFSVVSGILETSNNQITILV